MSRQRMWPFRAACWACCASTVNCQKRLNLLRKIQARSVERIIVLFCLFLLAVTCRSLVAQTPPTLVLMHSHMGIRIEYDIGAQRLNLWISPSPTTSIDYHDRNFSNRDDHTSLFDRIRFPDLTLETFWAAITTPFIPCSTSKTSRFILPRFTTARWSWSGLKNPGR